MSDESGEGALVSEVAVRHLSPPPTIIRGSKLLASDDWLGHNFQLLFSSSPELMRELEDLHVDYLVVDTSADPTTIAYRPQVEEVIASVLRPRRADSVRQGASGNQGVPAKAAIARASEEASHPASEFTGQDTRTLS